MFGKAIDTAKVRIRRRRWLPLQPRQTTMAPAGHLHFHPLSASYCDDFSRAPPGLQGHFIHEMTHVWQAQTRGRAWVILRGLWDRRYDYRLAPGKPLHAYGLEQQAEIVAHAFMLRKGWSVPKGGSAPDYAAILAALNPASSPPPPSPDAADDP